MEMTIEHDKLEKLHEFFKVTNPNKDYPTYVKNILCKIFPNDNKRIFIQIENILKDNIGTSLKDKYKIFFKKLEIDQTNKDEILKQIKEIRAKSDEELKRKIFKAIKEINLPLSKNEEQEFNKIYKNHLNPVGQMLDWLQEQIEYKVFIDDNKSSYKSGFKQFATALFGFYKANTWLSNDDYDSLFCQLIAENTLFASIDVFNDVKNGNLGAAKLTKSVLKTIKVSGANEYGSWDYMAHARRVGEEKNTLFTDVDNDEVTAKIEGKYPGLCKKIIVDDNTWANIYIKTAILKSYNKKFPENPLFEQRTKDYFADYEACHVWDLPGDRRYYASIGNLVLVPRALAQLTDHCDAVKQLLRYEVWKRFGFKPDEEKEPKEPKSYENIHWRDEYDGNKF